MTMAGNADDNEDDNMKQYNTIRRTILYNAILYYEACNTVRYNAIQRNIIKYVVVEEIE